jgi:hypothetical protein
MSQESFTSIDIEVYISGAWVSLWADVITSIPIKGSRGFKSNAINEFIADTGELDFSLDNSAQNSTAQIGRYSPAHANCLSGWTTGLPVRLTFVYDTWTVTKWSGWIKPDGITPYPGTYGPRRVDVSCYDYIGLLTNHKIELLTPQTNKTVTEALRLVLGNMPVQPNEMAVISTRTMPYIFDTGTADTTALSEFFKIASSNNVMLYIGAGSSGADSLQLDTQKTGFDRSVSGGLPLTTADSTDTMLWEDGDDALWEDGDTVLWDAQTSPSFDGSYMEEGTQISFGREFYNTITRITYPREIDAAATTILWTLENATTLAAGESATIRGQYTDPSGGGRRINGTEMVTPVSGTDFAAFANEDGTGTNYTAYMSVTATFGAAEVELTITNTHATDALWFGGGASTVQVRGKGIYLYDTTRVVGINGDSVRAYGERALTLDYKYQTDSVDLARGAVSAFTTADWLVPDYSIDAFVMTANKSRDRMSVFLFFEPRIGATITESVTALSNSYVGAAENWWMMGYEFELTAGIVKWTSIWRKD